MGVVVQDLTPLIELCHSRWVIPVIGELGSLAGAKLVTLANRLEIAQTTARRALDRAIALGWVRRNTGYGHPLRPEYLCTHKGSRISPRCVGLVASIEGAAATNLCARKWSIPILASIQGGAARFGELRNTLAPASDRALSLALRELNEGALIERLVQTEYPPAVSYRLTSVGTTIALAATSLGRDAASG